jgi:hypothetical protein
VLSIDNLHANAYSLRSSLTVKLCPTSTTSAATSSNISSLLGLVEEEEDRIRSCLLTLFPPSTGCVLAVEDLYLHRAAEDSLLGFLLGGSTDFELAANAEEAAVETCRKFAKQVFMSKHANSSDNDDTNTASTGPKPWLIATYLSAYSLLSDGLQLYGHIDHNVHYSATNTTNDESANMNDIDEDNSISSIYNALPPPPRHLLDSKSHFSDVEPVGVICKDEDKRAYNLLLQLVTLLESYCVYPGKDQKFDNVEDAYKTLFNAIDNTSGAGYSSKKSMHMVSTTSNVEERDSEMAVLLGANSNTSGAYNLVGEGLVEHVEPIDMETKYSVVEDNTATTASTDFSTVTMLPDISNFQQVLALLRDNSDLTGVHFNANGTIDRITLPYTSLYNTTSSNSTTGTSSSVRDRMDHMFDHLLNKLQGQYADEDNINNMYGNTSGGANGGYEDGDYEDDDDDDDDGDNEEEEQFRNVFNQFAKAFGGGTMYEEGEEDEDEGKYM